MSAKTRIVVLKMKELTYAAIFVGLAIVMIILMICMFSSKGEEKSLRTSKYTSGIYTASITLSGAEIDVEVSIDKDHINQIRFVNLSNEMAASFPLMESSLTNLATQIIEKQSTEDLCVSLDARYTSIMIVQAINKALDMASSASQK